MTCGGCQYLGRNCGGPEGNPGAHTVDPLSLSSRQLLEIACVLARVGTVLCDIGRKPDPFHGVGDPPYTGDPPYIWDIKED